MTDEIGPVEYMIVAFPGNRFRGEIAPALAKLVEAGTIRLMDVVFVGKDADGEVMGFELSELDPDVREGLERLGIEETGLFTVLAEDLEFTDHVHGLCGEHLTLGRLLDRIEAGSHDLFPDFEQLLRAHIDREENGLFPAAAIAFAGPEWERVAGLTPEPAVVVPG